MKKAGWLAQGQVKAVGVVGFPVKPTPRCVAERRVSCAQVGRQKGEPRAKRAVSFSREMAAAVGAVARWWLDAEGVGRLRASWWALAGAAANFGRGVPVVGLGSAAESAPRMLGRLW